FTRRARQAMRRSRWRNHQHVLRNASKRQATREFLHPESTLRPIAGHRRFCRCSPNNAGQQVYSELTEHLNALSRHWEELKKDTIPELNRQLQMTGLPAIQADKPLATELSGAGEGDDEP